MTNDSLDELWDTWSESDYSEYKPIYDILEWGTSASSDVSADRP